MQYDIIVKNEEWKLDGKTISYIISQRMEIYVFFELLVFWGY